MGSKYVQRRPADEPAPAPGGFCFEHGSEENTRHGAASVAHHGVGCLRAQRRWPAVPPGALQFAQDFRWSLGLRGGLVSSPVGLAQASRPQPPKHAPKALPRRKRDLLPRGHCIRQCHVLRPDCHPEVLWVWGGVRVYGRVYARVYVHVCACTCVHARACTYMYVATFVRVCKGSCVSVCVRVCTRVCMDGCARARMCGLCGVPPPGRRASRGSGIGGPKGWSCPRRCELRPRRTSVGGRPRRTRRVARGGARPRT